MDISDNTVLITGGSSGIGLELAKQLMEAGNKVIVTGRDEAKLAAVGRTYAGMHTVVCDVANPASIAALHTRLAINFPALNVVINCAGIMRKINLHERTDDLQGLTTEINTNLQGTIWVNQVFLPLLKKQPRAAIVNVSSGLAFVPMAIAPIYSATKAGLHAYTRALRLQLKRTRAGLRACAAGHGYTAVFRRFHQGGCGWCEADAGRDDGQARFGRPSQRCAGNSAGLEQCAEDRIARRTKLHVCSVGQVG